MVLPFWVPVCPNSFLKTKDDWQFLDHQSVLPQVYCLGFSIKVSKLSLYNRQTGAQVRLALSRQFFKIVFLYSECKREAGLSPFHRRELRNSTNRRFSCKVSLKLFQEPCTLLSHRKKSSCLLVGGSLCKVQSQWLLGTRTNQWGYFLVWGLCKWSLLCEVARGHRECKKHRISQPFHWISRKLKDGRTVLLPNSSQSPWIVYLQSGKRSSSS